MLDLKERSKGLRWVATLVILSNDGLKKTVRSSMLLKSLLQPVHFWGERSTLVSLRVSLLANFRPASVSSRTNTGTGFSQVERFAP